MIRTHSLTYRFTAVESLEPRALFSVTVDLPLAPINVSRFAGPQAEGTIAINPANADQVFAAANMSGSSLFAAVSTKAGTEWTGREFATGSDGLPRACCDPSAVYDEFGNLFFTYLNSVDERIELLMSTDAGRNFTRLATFKDPGDQPTVVAADGNVWVAYQLEDEGAIAYHARVTGLGRVGKLKGQRIVRGEGQNIGDIAIGPNNQVLVAYQTAGATAESASNIVVQLDSDGPGSKKFSKAAVIGTTNVGDFDKIPAQVRRTIDAEVGLAYDRSGGPFTGRAYMVYTDETPDESDNTDIFLRYSDNDGQSWSTPVRVNDDTGTNSQFLPRIAVDQTTGNVAIVWHDSRLDNGVLNSGSRDTIPNNDAGFWGTVGSPSASGVDFGANFKISTGTSSTVTANNPNDFGDYTGLTFYGGRLRPAWADNSNTTSDNPDGVGNALDLYTSVITVTTDPLPTLSTPTARLTAKPTAGRGKSYSFNITYTDPGGDFDLASLDGNDVQISGPNGFTSPVQFRKAKRKGAVITATYTYAPPGGPRASGSGVYTIALQPNEVADLAGNFAAARTLFGTFVV